MQCAKLTEDLYNTSYEDLNSVSIGKAKPSAASPNRPDEVSFTDKMYKAFGGANRGGSKVAPQMLTAMTSAVKQVTSNNAATNHHVTATSYANNAVPVRPVKGSFLGAMMSSIQGTIGRGANKKVLNGLSGNQKFQTAMQHMRTMIESEESAIMKYHIERQGGELTGYAVVPSAGSVDFTKQSLIPLGISTNTATASCDVAGSTNSTVSLLPLRTYVPASLDSCLSPVSGSEDPKSPGTSVTLRSKRSKPNLYIQTGSSDSIIRDREDIPLIVHTDTEPAQPQAQQPGNKPIQTVTVAAARAEIPLEVLPATVVGMIEFNKQELEELEALERSKIVDYKAKIKKME